MDLLDIQSSIASISQRLTIDELLVTNEESAKYGLLLSARDASELIESRNLTIHNYGRVELGIDVVKRIISEFCSSPFINTEDYAMTLNELVDIFYYMKNETDDRIGDSELIGLMKVCFNNSCRGSTELLKNRELALIARILKKSWDYTRGDD
jgi:hypothetical protein